MTVLVFAPNWLGDAVMALPAVADLRRYAGAGSLVVAARPSVAGLFHVVPGVNDVVAVTGARGRARWGALGASVRTVEQVHADVAVLLPNSFHTALVARRAGIPERWGYRRNLRGWLLSRAVPRPRAAVHQVDDYRHLVAALGIENGPRMPRLEAPRDAVEAARRMVAESGWTPGTPLVGIAPGAAYGGAKRWLPDRFARVIAGLARSRGAAAVLVGSEADGPAAWAIERELDKIVEADARPATINLVGRTDLPRFMGVLALCAVFVSNDSGAMHLAAALGVPVVALFGPTDDRATAPVAARATVLTSPAWCRPCLLRECPLDHRCMTGIEADAVIRAAGELL
jgi:heptosyltransferase-2